MKKIKIHYDELRKIGFQNVKSRNSQTYTRCEITMAPDVIAHAGITKENRDIRFIVTNEFIILAPQKELNDNGEYVEKEWGYDETLEAGDALKIQTSFKDLIPKLEELLESLKAINQDGI